MKIESKLGRPAKTFGDPVCRVSKTSVKYAGCKYTRLEIFLYHELVSETKLKEGQLIELNDKGNTFELRESAHGFKVQRCHLRALKISTQRKEVTLKPGYYKLVSKELGILTFKSYKQ